MNKEELQILQESVVGSFEEAGYRVLPTNIEHKDDKTSINLLLDEEIKIDIVVYENKVFLNDNLHNIQLLGEVGSETVVNSINEFIKA